MNTISSTCPGSSQLVRARDVSSGVGLETQVSPGSVEELEFWQLHKEAEDSADSAIVQLGQFAEEYQALGARVESFLATFGLNKAELREKAKCCASTAASVRQRGRSDDPEDELGFAEEVLKATANTRAECGLAVEIRNVRNRSCRLSEEIATLERAVGNASQLEVSDPRQAKEWQAEAAHFEEKAKMLRRQIDDLRIPSESALQKRYDEYVELKAKVSCQQKYLQQFGGLPPSLVEASEKLNAANQELSELRSKLRKDYQLSF